MRRSPALFRRDGYSLVELITAAVVMLLAVASVIVAVRKGAEMQVDDYHRRQARTIIMNTFETTFHFGRFPGPYSIPGVDLIHVGDQPVIVPDIVIDKRIDGGQPLAGEMRIAVAPGTVHANGVDVSAHSILATVRWTNIDGRADSVTLTKQLAGIFNE
jgi:hypothetical protein